MKEIWKPIKGYEGLYEAGTNGFIRNAITKEIKSMRLNKFGYYVVELYKNNVRKHKRVHRIIAETFIPKEQWNECINHKDENKENNRLDNLEFCTMIENIKYGTRGIRSGLARFNHPLRSKKILQISSDGKVLKEWCSIAEAYRQTKICRPNIIKCLKGLRSHAGGYQWKYKE
jgi:hypothetical protein